MKILTVVGARPQFIKLAPLAVPLEDRFESVVVHTGQHYDLALSDNLFQELRMPVPRHFLGIGSGSHGWQTGRMLEALEEVLLAERPDCVLVFGDTNSTLAGALAAAKLGIPLAHVEAGLRSFNMAMPEEINRRLTDHLSGCLFAPTEAACRNLANEGITRNVHLVGDIMADSLRATMARPAEVSVPGGPYYVLTLHRAENTKDPGRVVALLEGLDGLDVPVLFPCHPRTRELLSGWQPRKSLRLLEPFGHRDILELVRSARSVLTDSGGLQKEAYLLGTPCLTLRGETEWVETVETGWNRLVPPQAEEVLAALETFRPEGERPDFYGDGDAAGRIVRVLEAWLSELRSR